MVIPALPLFTYPLNTYSFWIGPRVDSDSLFRVSDRGLETQRTSVPTGAETPTSFLNVSQLVPFAFDHSSMPLITANYVGSEPRGESCEHPATMEQKANGASALKR